MKRARYVAAVAVVAMNHNSRDIKAGHGKKCTSIPVGSRWGIDGAKEGLANLAPAPVTHTCSCAGITAPNV